MTRRGSNPSDSRRYLDWINASYDDYRAAQLLSTDPTLHNATSLPAPARRWTAIT